MPQLVGIRVGCPRFRATSELASTHPHPNLCDTTPMAVTASPKAQALHREARAVELLMAGRDYDQIAAELGYSSRSGAWRAVQRALRKHREEVAGEYLTLELDRLDVLQAALWDAAMNGDPKAVEGVLKIIDRRCELLGLVPPKGRKRSTKWATEARDTVVVDPGDLVARARGT